MRIPGTGFDGAQERSRSEKGSKVTETEEKKKKLERTKRGEPQATKGLKGATRGRMVIGQSMRKSSTTV